MNRASTLIAIICGITVLHRLTLARVVVRRGRRLRRTRLNRKGRRIRKICNYTRYDRQGLRNSSDGGQGAQGRHRRARVAGASHHRAANSIDSTKAAVVSTWENGAAGIDPVVDVSSRPLVGIDERAGCGGSSGCGCNCWPGSLERRARVLERAPILHCRGRGSVQACGCRCRGVGGHHSSIDSGHRRCRQPRAGARGWLHQGQRGFICRARER